MFQGAMSNSTLSQDETLTSNNNNNTSSFNPLLLPQNTSNNNITQQPTSLLPKKVKKKRNLPGNPDPDAEVIALSPKSLLATNRFVCEICSKGFQRDQNLQLHRRGHNLPWKLKQRNKLEVVRKKAYVCPETSCVHHHPSRALGDLTGIKKHFCRKHGEKKFKCEKCSKIYAVHSDWKAHSKTCGTREYRCDCGTLFSRKDSFITHRAFCDALAEESARLSTNPFSNPMFPPPQSQPQTMPPPPPLAFSTLSTTQNPSHLFPFSSPSSISLSSSPWDPSPQNPNNLIHVKSEINHFPPPPQQQQTYFQPPSLFSKGMMTSPFTSDTNSITAHFLSATALLQKATAVGATLQQSHQSQQAQTMLNGFDELGPSFRPVGPTNNNNMSPFLLSSTNTTTTATTATPATNYYNHNHQNMNMSMDMANQGSFATWKKSEQDTTRDFLGLTNRSEVGFDEDDMEGNMLKFTGGLQYNHHMTTSSSSYDHDTSSPTSMLLKPHHQQQQVHDNQGNFGSFIPSETSANGATLDSRWG